MLQIEPFECGSSKERLRAAFKGEKTDRVPNFEILIEDEHVERLLGRKAGNTLGVGGDPAKGSEAAEGVRPMYAKDYVEVCRLIGQDAIAMEAFWTPFKRIAPDGTPRPITDRSVKTRADLENIIWPTQEDMEERLQYLREYNEAVKDTNIGVIFGGFCIFQTLYEFVIGMHDTMIMIYEDRDLLDELMSRSADYYAELIKRSIEIGVDAFFAADDFAFKSGLLVRPHVFEEIWRPHFDRILAPMRDADIPIMFHSDGKIDEAVDMLLDMGVDCLTTMDPSGVDYRDFKKRYGHRVTLHGNIDLAWPLATGTPEEVDKDVKEHMDALKPGGRWIAGCSHSIVNYVPHDNFITMINAIHKYGAY